MSTFTNTTYLKEILLSAVMLMLVLGPFQPLIAQAESAASADQTSPSTAQTTAVTPTSAGAAPQQQATNPPSCSFTPGTWDLCITNVVYVFTVGIGSGFAYVAAYFFDLAVNLSLNGPAYALTFISTGWTTARDLANMAFLFILIYIAFTIMLEAETSGTMSLLAGVVLIALLVNFSFFFTRIVIDAGNILSIQFYNSITAPSVQSTAGGAGLSTGNLPGQSTVATGVSYLTGVGANTKDLTASIMGMLQLQNLFNTQSFQNFYGSNQDTQGFLVVVLTLSFLYISAGIMFYLITVMFVTAGVKFLLRIVVLWFLIIASPLAFVARAMPAGNKLRGYFDKWRELLISHAFYPVAFMFIFLILTNFTNQMGNCTNNGTTSSQSCLVNDIFTSLPQGASSNSALVVIGIAIANVAIRMGFVLAILYMGMKVADSVSVMGADYAKSAGNWVGTGLLKSYNVGYKRAWVSPGGGFGALDRSLEKGALAKVGNSAIGYELRRYVTKPLGGTTIPGSHGESYLQMKDRQGKEYKERGANKLARETGIRDEENKEHINKIGETIAANIKAGKKAGDSISDDDKKKVQNLNKRELEAMNATQIKQISALLSEDQIKRVKEMEKLTDQEKEEANNTWQHHSGSSALGEARTQIGVLKEIRDELTLGGVAMPQLGAHTASGATMNLANIKAIADEIDEKLAQERDKSRDRTLTPADRRIAEKNTIKLARVSAEVKTLKEKTGKVGTGVGGSAAAKEFKVD